MSRSAQARVLLPKKRPVQARSQATFDAIVDACTGLLADRGYARTTTNHIAQRAGVNIASLYEYFPGKDAVVAEVAARLVDRVLRRLARGAVHAAEAGEELAFRRWIEWVHDTLVREKKLVAVFLYQVPYTNELESIQGLGARLLEFSRQARGRAGGLVRADFSDATLQLLINLVTSTIMQLVFDPPRSISRRALLDELIVRAEAWTRD